jgi:hypothetical protein
MRSIIGRSILAAGANGSFDRETHLSLVVRLPALRRRFPHLLRSTASYEASLGNLIIPRYCAGSSGVTDRSRET